MKFICISDTHGKHHELQNLPQADVIIHAGDICNRGYRTEAEDFFKWFSALPYKYKIFIAGNHDFYLEHKTEMELKNIIPENIIYLNDSSINIEGIKIYGSPITPWFFAWAFNRQRGAEIKKYWDLIESDADIIITHGPAADILDKTTRGESTGCVDLLEKINTIKPKFHICGHIHEAYGMQTIGDITFINCSVLNEKYILQNTPIAFSI